MLKYGPPLFFHQEKRHRAIETQILKPRERLEIRLIHSPGYRKNIGIGRLYDHGVFAYNLLRTLNKQNFISPDVVFIGYPPIETSAVMAHWLKKIIFRSFLDIKDQWPSIFLNKIPPSLKWLGRLIFSPYFLISKKTFRDADCLCSISRPFLGWARQYGNVACSPADLVIPLTVKRKLLNASESNRYKRSLADKGIELHSKRRCFVL